MKIKPGFVGTRHGSGSEYESILNFIRRERYFDFMRDSEEFMTFEKELEEKTA